MPKSGQKKTQTCISCTNDDKNLKIKSYLTGDEVFVYETVLSKS